MKIYVLKIVYDTENDEVLEVVEELREEVKGSNPKNTDFIELLDEEDMMEIVKHEEIART
jgi:hypothetical protein|tara:strand:- start:725 stop:904 length:180 start_codon:yes stop_codon:yes gene_type:complete